MNRLIQPLEGRQLLSSTTSPVGPTQPIFPNLQSEPVHEFAGVSEKVRVGYLPKLQVGHVSQLHAEIAWGDGSASPASFERDKNGGIDVMGTHTYAKTGKFAISAGVTETPFSNGGPTPDFIELLGEIKTTATVTPTPPQITEVAGQKFTAVVGKFREFTLDVIFSTQINWGDGNTTPGTLTGGDLVNGNFTITGTHTYPKTGTYIVHTYIYSKVAGSHMKPSVAMDLVTIVHVMGKA